MELKLKELRKEKNLTQTKLAEYLNLTTVGYNGYETGNREPGINTLIKLADYYNVSMDYLVGRENTKDLITTHYKEKKELLQISEQLNSNNFQKLLIYGTALLDAQEA